MYSKWSEFNIERHYFVQAGFILHGTYGRKSGIAKCVGDQQEEHKTGKWKLLNNEAEGCVKGKVPWLFIS